MKKWQKNRNYKRIKDKDGNVVANIITVFGQDVEVSDEIFDTYSQMDRRAAGAVEHFRLLIRNGVKQCRL